MLDGIKKILKRKKTKPTTDFEEEKKVLDGLFLTKKSSKKSLFIWPNIFKSWPKIALAFIFIIGLILISFHLVSSKNQVIDKFDILKLFQHGKYLILFQNNSELRATGGFIGSFAVVDLDYGKIRNLYLDTNIYKRDDKYHYMLQKPAPEPMQSMLLKENYWAMRDANWAVDYSESARQVAWFYEHEGGTPVDGVIAINATTVADLLEIIGPVELSNYQELINKENFITVIQQEVEKNYYQSQENREIDEPKTIIAELFDKIMEKLKQKKYSIALWKFVMEKLLQKDILLYFYNQELEKIILAKNWGGAVIKPDVDYLYINNSNLGGQKSSLNIKQKLDMETVVENNGNVKDTLTITRVHTGNGEWPDFDNVNYLRILVPEGSKLISAELDEKDLAQQIQISSEAGKTVFGIWLTTPIGQTKILKISYELPFYLKNKKYYSFYLQKQPGAKNEEAQVIINGVVKFSDQFVNDQEIK